MKAEAAAAGRRLCRGTWRQLEAWGRWLSGETHADRAGLVRLGVILARFAGSVLAALFYALLLQRVPGGIYALPVVWAIGAWQMSDTSATPPPPSARPSCRECAGHELVNVTPLEGQKGMLIYTSAESEESNKTHVHIVRTADETHT
ncbi:hypothetical protein AQJ30_27490 [Streptomyces longwoodensis]|uniref:Uncharacterized protein n=1 Tax=Streptomyces longwoodensis TaxID=68231 RepID=A0A101QRV9_9ACTN|nr:hypothetical protein [Streptomyces longwoodensis]KUN34817.1 hypothetical protein AQJ30_27490 [Streptomyces longwoodensis]